MPSIGSITKTIRINSTDLAVLDEIMNDSGASWSGAVHILAEGYRGTPEKHKENREIPKNEDSDRVHPNKTESVNTFDDIPEEIVKDMKSMIRLWGMSEKKFFTELDEALNDGRVDVEGGKVVGHESLDLTKFYEKCRDMNAKPQDVIDKIVRSMG